MDNHRLVWPFGAQVLCEGLVMTDYPEAVREYEEQRELMRSKNTDPRYVTDKADAAIAALKEMVEKAEYAAKENREAMNNAVAAWREAEARIERYDADLHAAENMRLDALNRAEKAEYELNDLKRLTESLDGDRTLDRIRELESEVARLTKELSRYRRNCTCEL